LASIENLQRSQLKPKYPAVRRLDHLCPNISCHQYLEVDGIFDFCGDLSLAQSTGTIGPTDQDCARHARQHRENAVETAATSDGARCAPIRADGRLSSRAGASAPAARQRGPGEIARHSGEYDRSAKQVDLAPIKIARRRNCCYRTETHRCSIRAFRRLAPSPCTTSAHETHVVAARCEP